MSELTGSVETPTPRLTRLVASTTGLNRTDPYLSNEFGGYSNFDTSNRFTYYSQLLAACTHANTALNKLGLSLVKGMTYDGPARQVKEFQEWDKKTRFGSMVQTIARSVCRDGQFVGVCEGGKDSFRSVPLLMSNTTLIPEGFMPGDTAPKNIMTGPLKSVVVNEEKSTATSTPKHTIFDVKEDPVVYGAWNQYDGVQKDILKRDTYGLYGQSLIEPLELTIRNLLTVNFGYVSFVRKYGIGRYHMDFRILEEMLKNGEIDTEKAQQLVNNFLDEHKQLIENEDIATFGVDIKPLDLQGTLDILDYKKSLETDIQIGLFQSPLTMGDTKGSTYAAGYVSEQDRLVVLEELQQVIRDIVQSVIDKRLDMMNRSPGSVWVEFEELSTPQLDSSTVLEMYAMGIIDEDEVKKRYGFNVEGTK